MIKKLKLSKKFMTTGVFLCLLSFLSINSFAVTRLYAFVNLGSVVQKSATKGATIIGAGRNIKGVLPPHSLVNGKLTQFAPVENNFALDEFFNSQDYTIHLILPKTEIFGNAKMCIGLGTENIIVKNVISQPIYLANLKNSDCEYIIYLNKDNSGQYLMTATGTNFEGGGVNLAGTFYPMNAHGTPYFQIYLINETNETITYNYNLECRLYAGRLTFDDLNINNKVSQSGIHNELESYRIKQEKMHRESTEALKQQQQKNANEIMKTIDNGETADTAFLNDGMLDNFSGSFDKNSFKMDTKVFDSVPFVFKIWNEFFADERLIIRITIPLTLGLILTIVGMHRKEGG